MTLAPSNRARASTRVRAGVGARLRRLAVMTLVAFGLTSVGLLAAPGPTLAWDAGAFSSSSESQLVSLTNQSRAAAGLKALKVDSKLASIARWRSKDMIDRNYFSHNIPPSGDTVFHTLDQKGYCYNIAGENIAWNTYPDDVATSTAHDQFMHSAGHRANVLGKAWDVIGIGAYKGADGKKMWTVLFADRCGSTAPPPTPRPKPRATPRPVTKPHTATPKPHPTPRPTPQKPAAPTPTPTPAPTTLLTIPPELSGPTGPGSDPGSAGAVALPTGPGIRIADPASDEASLRVVRPVEPPGLFEAVVGGVTGLFFGG